MKSLAGILAAVAAIIVPGIGLAQRAIPDDNLAIPVFILGVQSQGSGFYLATPTSLYLVTAKHVIERESADALDPAKPGPRLTLMSYPVDPKDPGRDIIILDLSLLAKAGELRLHPTEDIAVVRVATAPTQPGSMNYPCRAGSSKQESSKAGIGAIPLAYVKRFDEVLISNETLTIGYPTSLGRHRQQ
jgi:hypothetical protein